MANKITDTPCPLTDIFYLQRLWPQQSSRLLSPTRSDQFSAECVCHLAEEAVAFWKKPAFVWKPREMFSVSLPPQKSNGFSFCSRGMKGGSEEWRKGGKRGKRMDGFLSTITFISHLLLCQGGCLRALQNKLRVIFLWDADWGEGDNNDFSHVIKVVFTSACGSQRIVFFPQCDK